MNKKHPVGSRGLGAARGFKRAKLDNYPTAPKLTHALAAHLRFPRLRFYGASPVATWHAGPIWEPACGDGAISEVLEGYGAKVISTDIARRGYGASGVNFLTTKKARADTIITNPPFNLWTEFADHALTRLKVRRLALLGRVLLLEGFGRSEFFKQTRLDKVVIVGRANMRPPRTKDKGQSGMIAFAWFIWDRTEPFTTSYGPDYHGPMVMWEKPALERNIVDQI